MKQNKILVVDGEQYLLDLFVSFLSEEGYQVETSAGDRVIEKALALPADLILLDAQTIHLTGGIELSQHLKATPATRHIPIILMSTDHRLKEQVKSNTKADYFLQKPFNLDEILAAVHTALVNQEA